MSMEFCQLIPTIDMLIHKFIDAKASTVKFEFLCQLVTHRYRQSSFRTFPKSESLNSNYLTPYLESSGQNFTNGANFAISGSSTLPRSVLFSLDVQILQFNRFHNRSLEFVSKGVKYLVGDEDFKNALYTIDIGQNDLSAAFGHLSFVQVTEQIPSFISEIKDAIWSLYQHGGKNFWVHNTGPLGCLPQKLATSNENARIFDKHGCLQSLNEGAQLFNEKLRELCEQLRSEMKNATIVYVDVYAIKYDLIAHSAIYGEY
ncbi:unnamed protein product [Ilex paraguariensis]|uniref:GDSL esterase/lipase n=1 Tax=Ilex paraguariensis TaxID=185542 RepID=A0ABC8TBH2_9AQUA